jgi:hypothetical protein
MYANVTGVNAIRGCRLGRWSSDRIRLDLLPLDR